MTSLIDLPFTGHRIFNRIGVFILFLSLLSYQAVAQETSVFVDLDTRLAGCMACHGEKGISNSDMWPNLAGQQPRYLENQMIAFRDGSRLAPGKEAVMKDLSDVQIMQIAKYFSSLPHPEPSNQNVNKAGERVRAYCVSCHGMTGNTVVPEWPNLAGQKRSYLVKQLLAYKSGERQHPLMNVIAAEISEQNIDDVAEYYSQIGISRPQ